MKRWVSALVGACLSSCNVSTPSPYVTPEPVASAPIVVELPEVNIVARRLPRHVLVTGDSEACRVGLYAKSEVAKLNAENHEPADTVYVDCKGGTTVDYWGRYGNLKRALDNHPDTDDVVIFLGTNHYWNQRDTPNVWPILKLVSERAVRCTWVGNTAVHGKHWNINGLLHFAVSPECDYFDTEAANVSLEDGVHPGRASAVRWLRLVWATIPPRFDEATDQ